MFSQSLMAAMRAGAVVVQSLIVRALRASGDGGNVHLCGYRTVRHPRRWARRRIPMSLAHFCAPQDQIARFRLIAAGWEIRAMPPVPCLIPTVPAPMPVKVTEPSPIVTVMLFSPKETA